MVWVRPRKVNRSFSHKARMMQRFPHAADTRAGGSEGNAGTRTLPIPAGTEAELEAAAAEETRVAAFLGQEGRMAVVAGKDNAADSQRGGNGRAAASAGIGSGLRKWSGMTSAA
jgi:hypothetical protein